MSSSRPSRPQSLTPPKRTKTEDPGAHELESDSEEHFSDAQSNVMSPAPASPVPRTRVEKVSDEPSYGEVPGTEAYNKRTGDAAPDEIAVVPDADTSNVAPVEHEEDMAKAGSGRESPLPGGQPIPVTVVEQAAGDSGPHSEVFESKRKADAPPDLVVKPDGSTEGTSDSDEFQEQEQEQEEEEEAFVPVLPASVSPVPEASIQSPAPHFSPPGGFPVTPSDFGDDFPSTAAAKEENKQDAPIDGAPEDGAVDDHADKEVGVEVVEAILEHSESAQQDEPPTPETTRDENNDGDFGDDFGENNDGNDDDGFGGNDDGFGDDFGEDFDDFEDGADDAGFDDFGDDNAFQQPDLAPPVQPPAREPSPRPNIQLPLAVPDFDGLESDEIFSVLDPYLALLFPPEQLVVPDLPPPSKGDPIFLTPRSVSLWSQLVEPPPLAPPDWIRSRIRRAFLVSLGVPVDLDEILPASKQKKLILPSLTGGVRGISPYPGASRSASRLRLGGVNASTTSVDSYGNPKPSSNNNTTTSGRSLSPSKAAATARRGQPAEPEFDLVSARQLCTTTSEALDGMTDAELRSHVARLEAMQSRSRLVCEYWQKRADEKIGDREAFEGVIENLVKHARKVRK